MIKIEQLDLYQGATAYISFNYLDANGLSIDLAGTSAVFAYRKTGETVRVTPTITGSVITTKLSPSVTETMIGVYDYELKLKDIEGEIEVIGKGTFKILESLIPKFDVVGEV